MKHGKHHNKVNADNAQSPISVLQSPSDSTWWNSTDELLLYVHLTCDTTGKSPASAEPEAQNRPSFSVSGEVSPYADSGS